MLKIVNCWFPVYILIQSVNSLMTCHHLSKTHMGLRCTFRCGSSSTVEVQRRGRQSKRGVGRTYFASPRPRVLIGRWPPVAVGLVEWGRTSRSGSRVCTRKVDAAWEVRRLTRAAMRHRQVCTQCLWAMFRTSNFQSWWRRALFQHHDLGHRLEENFVMHGVTEDPFWVWIAVWIIRWR
jgi:hypothetical protein